MRKRSGSTGWKRWRRLRYAFIGAAGAVSLPCAWVFGAASVLVHNSRPVLDHYIAELSTPSQAARSARIPRMMSDALIAVEDRNFPFHHGVDWQALRRAFNEDAQSLSYSHGGSTITMQAVRYIALPYDKTITRKVAEIELAMDLERRVPKPEILLLYFDSVSFGLHTAGLDDASRTFFGVRPEHLTLAQSALLAGLISSPPATFADLSDSLADRVRNRALSAVNSRFPEKYSQSEISAARKEPLVFAWQVPTRADSRWRAAR